MFTGVDAVIFGADDFESSKRFLEDFGLTEEGSMRERLRFVTQDRSELIIYKPDNAILPPAYAAVPSPNLREIVWGMKDQQALDTLAKRLGPNALTDTEGRLAIVDPDGLTHAFRISQRINVIPEEQLINSPGHYKRVDRRSPIYRSAKPIGIGHVVVHSNNMEVLSDFFKEKCGFVEADRFKNFGIFLRAVTPGSHHHFFIQNRPSSAGIDHVSFTLSHTLEILGGGLHMRSQGWDTWLGPGFHPVSSAYYWYFQSPFGPRLEYYGDDDYCTENWKPEVFNLSPALYVDLAVDGFHRKGDGARPDKVPLKLS